MGEKDTWEIFIERGNGDLNDLLKFTQLIHNSLVLTQSGFFGCEEQRPIWLKQARGSSLYRRNTLKKGQKPQ